MDKKIEYCKAIDKVITCYMREHRLTQAEMASKLGISTTTLRWKREGDKEWKLSELVRIAELCHVSLDEVFAI